MHARRERVRLFVAAVVLLLTMVVIAAIKQIEQVSIEQAEYLQSISVELNHNYVDMETGEEF
jgi:hypothetical protein